MNWKVVKSEGPSESSCHLGVGGAGYDCMSEYDIMITLVSNKVNRMFRFPPNDTNTLLKREYRLTGRKMSPTSINQLLTAFYLHTWNIDTIENITT